MNGIIVLLLVLVILYILGKFDSFMDVKNGKKYDHDPVYGDNTLHTLVEGIDDVRCRCVNYGEKMQFKVPMGSNMCKQCSLFTGV